MSATPLFLTSYDLVQGNVSDNYEGNLSLIAPKPGPSDIWQGYYEGNPDLIVCSMVYRDDDGDSRRLYEANTDFICPVASLHTYNVMQQSSSEK